jgi:hypothetical protein
MRRLRFIVGALPAVLWIAPLHAQQPTATIPVELLMRRRNSLLQGLRSASVLAARCRRQTAAT